MQLKRRLIAVDINRALQGAVSQKLTGPMVDKLIDRPLCEADAS
jgi:hypothetical protein